MITALRFVFHSGHLGVGCCCNKTVPDALGLEQKQVSYSKSDTQSILFGWYVFNEEFGAVKYTHVGSNDKLCERADLQSSRGTVSTTNYVWAQKCNPNNTSAAERPQKPNVCPVLLKCWFCSIAIVFITARTLQERTLSTCEKNSGVHRTVVLPRSNVCNRLTSARGWHCLYSTTIGMVAAQDARLHSWHPHVG